ncbi:MAG: T9SS type A sorting domain-containing protein, partial [Bacteroidales bacterium]
GTKQIGSVNFYAGAPWGDISKYYFDDPAFMVYKQGLSNPVVNIDTSSINIALKTNESVIINRIMSNQGESDLIYEIIPTYSSNTNISQNETEYSPTGIKLTNLKSINPDSFSSTPNFTDQDVILHYDGDNLTAIGSPFAYEYRVSSMFPYEMIQPYIGMVISSVEVYINDPVNEAKIQIYKMGTLYSPGPGELLLEQNFSAVAYGWNVVELNTPITITGRDIWVGWSMSAPGNHYAPGCDAGPANGNGDWISTGTGWSHLSTNPEMNYNWNIRANLSGSPSVQWLSTTPFTGELSHDEELEIGINIDATGLVSNVYEGTVILRTNDRENQMVPINVILTITNGISTNGEPEYLSVYPNPVSKILHVSSNVQITKMQLINAAGQVVFNNTVNEINVSYFDKGIYILLLNTKNGCSTQHIIIQ